MIRFSILMLFFYVSLSAQVKKFPVPKAGFDPRTYVAARILQPLKIDGRLVEFSWQTAKWSEPFVDIRGKAGPQPRFRTRVKMLWDDRCFYFAAELEEPHVWATLTKRDAVIYHDNDFEIFIDPDGDTHNYYELEINALNTVWDLFLDKPYRDGAHPLFFWDIRGLQTAVQVQGTLNNPADTDSGWTVEMAIPWEVLKECANKATPPQNGDQWRLNFSRVQWQTRVENGNYVKRTDASGNVLREDNWVWSPQGLVAMHYPEMWGIVQFSEQPAGSQVPQVQITEEDRVKWKLRQVYYAQKEYFREHGKYASGTELPGSLKQSEFFENLQIFLTPSMFEARIANDSDQSVWYIRQDGLIWNEK